MLLLDDVIQEYLYHCMAKGFTKKTMINKRFELNQAKEYLQNKRGLSTLESVTIHDLKAYVRYKHQSGLKPQSIVSLFKMVRAFFSWCEKEEYLQENIAKKVELPKVPKRVFEGLTTIEVQAMINSFSYKSYLEARNKAIIAMMADCGLRAMEVRGITNEDVKETAILVHGKGNKERFVYISPALKKILIRYERLKREYFKERLIEEDFYFLNYVGRGLSHIGLDNLVKEAGRRAGIDKNKVKPHNLRHYYSVTTLSEGHLDLHSLSRLLGHSEIQTTQIYLASLSEEQLSNKAISSSPLMNTGGIRKGKLR
ncbi:tyrosine-type recombinase/integrase [Bacillus sp. KH172YL63]|uniref:tyrosine-type recombinase/integrase n=1 Tax=Bacillus sp. KH172YL63 TaxID=2709784 RepID=UPI0013E4C511|nr:tyrosine-type recombinase/integrase [Bacillus sp. KH172YL63]BCB03496.1 tyrosine recombinase XerD [Bacillus sp. KH172YL63]